MRETKVMSRSILTFESAILYIYGCSASLTNAAVSRPRCSVGSVEFTWTHHVRT